MAVNRYKKICFLCGKEYKYCSNCRDYKSQPTWKNMFDTENCYNIFNLSTQFAQGVYTIDEANEILKNYDLSDIKLFRKDAIEQLNIIQSINQNKKKNSEIVSKSKDIEKNKDEKIEAEKDVFSESSTFKKKKKSMKKASDKKVFNEQ